MNALTQLPIGTGYNKRSGQASLDIRRGEGDTLTITATCDSLAREVIRLTEELTRIRDDTEVSEKPPEVVKEPTGWQWFWIRIGQLSVGAAALIALKKYINGKSIKL
ncbi:hypothetical protein [Bacteroides neonati]|uniref:hypothetical protein n=1 Tax=Bacteroides neonati TaxID=1347393 RepID=UPI001E449113|nr:hypothetical protein [Bacteroides neonati]